MNNLNKVFLKEAYVSPSATLLVILFLSVYGIMMASINHFATEDELLAKLSLNLLIFSIIPFIWIFKNEKLKQTAFSMLKIE